LAENIGPAGPSHDRGVVRRLSQPDKNGITPKSRSLG
jgi:hypothetical protein